MNHPNRSEGGQHSRRRFVQLMAAGAGVMLAPSFGWLRAETSANALDSGEPPKRKLGVALLGLGSYSAHQLAPALRATRWCKLAGAVTGTPAKVEQWKSRYQLPERSIYNYENFDRIADNPEIDIVYVVTPNALHADAVVRAAKAGKHVICEKPMATTVADCERMIAACREAGRMLSIGYRLHFEPYTHEIVRMGREKTFGPVKSVTAANGFVNSGNNWRTNRKLGGGGPLMDMGIYCVQAACYSTGEMPIAVTAREGTKSDPVKFAEVEESISWKLEFPSGATAECRTTYNESVGRYRVDAQDGWYELNPGFSYHGIRGRTSRGSLEFPDVNQQALQMDAFAKCILEKTPSTVPGEMGLRDLRIISAIYESAANGNRVKI